MSLRLIEVISADPRQDLFLTLQKDKTVIDVWQAESVRTRFIIKLLVRSEDSERVIDKVSRRFKKGDYFRIVVQSVDATLPLIEAPSQRTVGKLSVSREELYNQVTGLAELNYVYVLMVALASVIAALGLLEDKWVVLIGAMVVAPLIAPNISLSLGIVLAHAELAWLGGLGMAVGSVLALGIGYAVGWMYPLAFYPHALLQTLNFGYPDLLVALASGVAGVLAFTSGTAYALIGVMVSISLLPPLVGAGLVLSNGDWAQFFNALLLFLTNLVALNLAGVVTFWSQGVRPKNWWEEKKASHYRRWASVVWFILLLLMILGIYLTR